MYFSRLVWKLDFDFGAIRNPDPLVRGTDPDPSLFLKKMLGGLK
jgi:hypothetical protein